MDWNSVRIFIAGHSTVVVWLGDRAVVDAEVIHYFGEWDPSIEGKRWGGRLGNIPFRVREYNALTNRYAIVRESF